MEYVVQEAAKKVLDKQLAKARQLRQKQVRQQASQWAEEQRKRFEEEKLRQRQLMVKQITLQVEEYAREQINHLLTAHDLAVAEVGAAHRAAALLREEENARNERTKEQKQLAEQRGYVAIKQAIQSKNQLTQVKSEQFRRRELARKEEDRKSKELILLAKSKRPVVADVICESSSAFMDFRQPLTNSNRGNVAPPPSVRSTTTLQEQSAANRLKYPGKPPQTPLRYRFNTKRSMTKSKFDQRSVKSKAKVQSQQSLPLKKSTGAFERAAKEKSQLNQRQRPNTPAKHKLTMTRITSTIAPQQIIVTHKKFPNKSRSSTTTPTKFTKSKPKVRPANISKSGISPVRYFDTSVPKAETHYIAPEGLGVKEAARDSPDAWAKAEIISKQAMKEVEDKAKRQEELLRISKTRGEVALKRAKLEKKLTKLKSQLLEGENHTFFGTGNQVSLMDLDHGKDKEKKKEKKLKKKQEEKSQNFATPQQQRQQRDADFFLEPSDNETSHSGMSSIISSTPFQSSEESDASQSLILPQELKLSSVKIKEKKGKKKPDTSSQPLIIPQQNLGNIHKPEGVSTASQVSQKPKKKSNPSQSLRTPQPEQEQGPTGEQVSNIKIKEKRKEKKSKKKQEEKVQSVSTPQQKQRHEDSSDNRSNHSMSYINALSSTLFKTPPNESDASRSLLMPQQLQGNAHTPEGPYTSTPDGKMRLKPPTSSRNVAVSVNSKELILHKVISDLLGRRKESVDNFTTISSSSSSDLKIDSAILSQSSVSGLFSSLFSPTSTQSSSDPTKGTLVSSHDENEQALSDESRLNEVIYSVKVTESTSGTSGNNTTASSGDKSTPSSTKEIILHQVLSDILSSSQNQDSDRNLTISSFSRTPGSTGSSDPTTRDMLVEAHDDEEQVLSDESHLNKVIHSVKITQNTSGTSGGSTTASSGTSGDTKDMKRSVLRQLVGDLHGLPEFLSPIVQERSFREGEIVSSIFDQLKDDFAGLMVIDRPPWFV